MQVLTSTLSINLIDRPSNPISFYEIAISNDNTIAKNYWHLGVAYLLAGREDDAQAAWFTPFATSNESELENLTDDLISVLEIEASHLAQIQKFDQAWLIRQNIWILLPDKIENILHLICIENLIGTLTTVSLIEWRVNELLDASIESINEDLLEQVVGSLLDTWSDESLEVIRFCLQMMTLERTLVIRKLMGVLFQSFNQDGANLFIVKIVEICNEIQPNTLSILQVLSYTYSGVGLYDKATIIAKDFCRLASKVTDKLFGSYQLQRAHFTAGNLQDIDKVINLHRQLLSDIIQASPRNLQQGQYQSLIMSSFFLPYTEDNPRANKILQNQLATIYQQNVQPISAEYDVEESSLIKRTGCIRIGYIGIGFKCHSVGWLSRWLIQHHDRDFFQVFIYCLNTNKDDEFNHAWFRDKVDSTSYLNGSIEENVAQIKADEIDILIDLDSLTYDLTSLFMAHKPAPIQLSWLGWDSAGIPTVDYFIADPYVLPDDAQEYYSEKIWRLPHTYLAVDGFEIGTPNLLREDLDIPSDAVIYLSSQSGYKRHPDCIKAQMEIIKAVPNSYFLIKGKSDNETIQRLFSELALEVGISLDRLRFLERDIDEYSHRANLAIADVVLDTFPYNGATTTLETLWMGIPMVTQVGQQFAARNSYTFMINAGITEGIAWNQQEYIDWGIKLGLDRELRWQVKGKLHAGRTSAPVWNAKQFTLDMEQAYREMWAQYQEQQASNKTDTYDLN
ncbi:O-linked N-acetylglucosamine transferase, SPINDLY family protein [Chamaesiphon sp. VAR_48_metabat_135_sub]|uniref:O-linked N-acetylglucosamine transferase, SPINDLY family protein n=1 Tax=Chamaesiphon sp. VAR_48_metabat_135_sub TaxID=2964699 RepID=UPI00286C1ABC|nr:O-linked N-acetylglucosamine transferase, SPINDLY family protein [Chamaesiphon sp. VAR_48_metabat_135_sub]